MKTIFVVLGTIAMAALGSTALDGDRSGPDEEWGACCLDDGTCHIVYWGDCSGDYYHQQTCEDVTCEQPSLGACCLAMGGCEELLDYECNDINGTQFHDGMECAEAACAPVCPELEIFASIAYPLEISCGGTAPYFNGYAFYEPGIFIDLNGDGRAESLYGITYSWAYWEDPMDGCGCIREGGTDTRVARGGSKVGTIELSALINLHPDSMTYENFSVGEFYYIECRALFDVTGDGLVDAIIYAESDGNSGWFYAENISEPPAVACATDINNDGSTNVSDLLMVVGNWGPCE